MADAGNNFHSAVPDASWLRFADTPNMRIEFEPGRKSLAALWIGIILGALYLIFLRDVLRPLPAHGEERDLHAHKMHE